MFHVVSPSPAKAILPSETAAAVRFGCPEPTNVNAATPSPPAATARATTIAIPRRDVGRDGSGRGSRPSMSRQSSGGRARLSASNRSSKSVIFFLQELAEAPSAPHQVDADRRLGRADDPGDLLRGVAGAVVEDDRDPLPLG